MKLLFTASEASPFIMTGGLGEVAGALPIALAALNDVETQKKNDVRVVLPLYSSIPEQTRKKMTHLGHIFVPLSWRNQYCGVFSLVRSSVTYYFIDNEYYFKRETVYGHFDDGERFAFFSKAVLSVLKFIDFRPDLIHANDWQTALVPVYLNQIFKADPFYQKIKTMFTIHNIQYQGIYGKELLSDVFDLPPDCFYLLEHGGAINLMKGAIQSADFIGTVSPTYACEIQESYFAHGLDGILREYQDKLRGILNGIDVVSYNPRTDKTLAANYSAKDLSGKQTNKAALQSTLGLPQCERVPLIGMVTRLVDHKGLDLLTFIFDELMHQDIQLVILGTGDFVYQEYFYQKALQHKHKFGVSIGFDANLSRKIYAGADLFLMPSKSEPCGLAQMIALRYGTVPIVRETGGLKDSISDYGKPKGTGFTFQSYDAHHMLDAINRAIAIYHDEVSWERLQVHDMRQNFSWKASAKAYDQLYREIVTG